MGKKIVIADDEPITIMDISEILTEEGYNVVACLLYTSDAADE